MLYRIELTGKELGLIRDLIHNISCNTEDRRYINSESLESLSAKLPRAGKIETLKAYRQFVEETTGYLPSLKEAKNVIDSLPDNLWR